MHGVYSHFTTKIALTLRQIRNGGNGKNKPAVVSPDSPARDDVTHTDATAID